MELIGFLVALGTVGAVAYWLNQYGGRLGGPPRGKTNEAPLTAARISDVRVTGPIDFRTGIVTYDLPGSFGDLALRRECIDTDLKRLVATEIELGDAEFDREFYLEGPSALLRAVFDAETRKLVLQLPHVEIAAGQLRMKGDSEVLERIADRLARLDDLPASLADNARRDQNPQVRLQNLSTLIREYPKHPAARSALRVASEDESDEIRLRAGIALGEEGEATLLDLALGGKLATGWTADDAISARAVVALEERLSPKRLQEILETALLRRRTQTARACIDLLRRSGGAEAVGELVKIMLTGRGEIAAAAVQALGATGSDSAERPLLDALERGLPELRVPVAEALGRMGSARSVLPLKEAEDRFPADSNLRRAARQAIAEIQSRLSGASPGQLSLAEGQGGRLSLAGDEAGRLSLAKKEGSSESD
jgi:HEAT repeat protein